MALVPIIYTSLLIFIGLLIFVIGVSYISFKAKDKYRGPAEFKEIHPKSFEVRPTNYNFNNLSVKPVTVQYRQSIDYPKVNHTEKHARNNYRNSLPITIQNEAVNDFHSQQIKRNLKAEAYDKFQEAKRINQKLTFSRNRIEIMNNSDPFNNTSIESEFDNFDNSFRSRNNISEKNLFNYYSDVKDLDLVMLSAKHR
jgi:flagellar basal body-associated protein FliL